MTDIHGVQPSVAPKAVDAPGPIAAGQFKVQPAQISDVVEISSVARLAAKIQEVPEIRTELVERVKAEIAAGAYETPEKIDMAVDRLMDELFPRM